MYKFCLFLLLTVFNPCSSYMPGMPARSSGDDGLALLKQHVTKDILSATFNNQDVITIAGKMNADGSWPDIDYTDKTRGSWPVNGHLERLKNMAVLYTRPGSTWTGDKKLEQQILSGLNYWLKNDFICPNWWNPEIGVPKK